MNLNLGKIKHARIRNGLTQTDVALNMGFKNRSSYAKRELGIVPIGPDELAKMGKIFGYASNNLHIFFDQNVPKRER